MAKHFDRVGGGRFDVYKQRKGSTVWAWMTVILIVLILIGIAG